MGKSYSYKESKVTTKKLVGMYDAEKHGTIADLRGLGLDQGRE